MKHVLIVGGGFGGVKAALELAHQREFNVTLISDKESFSYYPALYRSATGSSHIESSIPLAKLFARNQNVQVLHDTATTLDTTAKQLGTASGQKYTYDYLILALGSVTNYFGIQGLQEFSYGIKSLDEATEFKEHLHKELTDEHKPDLNYVVIGGGPTGVELSGALGAYLRRIMKFHGVSAKQINIDLIEAAPRLLPRSAEAVSRRVEARLKRLGVNVMTGQKVEAETADALTVSGNAIATKTVVWTSGVSNNPFFGANASQFNLSKNGHIVVDQFMVAAPSVYVIGDNAVTPYSGLAQTALYDAEFVVSNLRRQERGGKPKVYRPSRPISVVPVGVNWAVVEWGSLHFFGYKGWILRRLADLVAYLDMEPLTDALGLWLTDNQREESCPVCAGHV